MSQVPVYFLLSLPLVGAFALFAVGIVVIHQSSRVLNLAHGTMAMVPAFVTYSLVQHHVPAVAALVLGVAFGALIGIIIERVFVRALRRQGPTAQTVGTIAALGILLSLAVKLWGTTPRGAVRLFPEGGIHVGASILRFGQIGLLAVAFTCVALLFALFRFTEVGLAMRSAADNRRAASLMGIDPDATTRLAWALGGALAALAGILLAPVTVLEPINLTLIVLPAFVAALLGGLSSLPGAATGSAVVGIVLGMVPAIALIPGIGGFATQLGAPQLVLTLVALVVMALRGERFVGSSASPALDEPAQSRLHLGSSFRRTLARLTGAGAVVGALLFHRAWVAMSLVVVGALLPSAGRAGRAVARLVVRLFRMRLAKAVLILIVLAGLIIGPFIGAPFSLLGDAIQACIILLIAASLVLLTGWVGQISLAQAALLGIGAFTTALLSNRAGLQFPLNLPLVSVASAGFAAVVGLVALRVRGLYLAVATLIVLWMSNEYLFKSPWLVGGAGGSTSISVKAIGRSGAFPFFDFAERRTFYYVALAVAAAVLWALFNVRDSKTGRAFFAVRGSETAAASLGIDVTRYKLLAFAISGMLAGIAGNLLITGAGSVNAEAQFGFDKSLFYLAVAVVGGVSSLGGAIGAAILFAGLGELFYRVTVPGGLELVSAGLLAGVLLMYPGGLAGIPQALARRMNLSPRRRTRARIGPAFAPHIDAPTNGSSKKQTAMRRPSVERTENLAVLDVEGLTVRFGGLVAVDDVSLSVREGEIVGLIGPNGAGKTTTFNAISGLVVPTGGRVRIFDHDVTDWPVHKRAGLGVGRTFQVVQLFHQLSIFENLLVATHLQNPTGVLAHVAVTSAALRGERAAREKVAGVIHLLDLDDIADRPVAGLPLG
ncbi:MAG: ATP-binding cassette domain-containing protein, partial [Actinomycetota bacterium]